MLVVHSSTRRILGAIAAATLFSTALFIVSRQLREFHYRDFAGTWRSVPAHAIGLAIALTVCGYAAMTGYDVLALRYAGIRLPRMKTMLASFVAFAINNSIGFAGVFGGSVRYRLYSAWNVGPRDVARIITFTTATFWLGFVTVTGASALVAGWWQGALLLALPAAYLAWSSARGRTAGTRVPHPLLALAQILLSTCDWLFAAGVLHALLPRAMSFAQFAIVFFVGQLAGVLSGLPGGIGVFDSVLLLAFRSRWPAHTLVSAMLLYRAIYYIGPLVFACVLLGAYELHRRRHALRRLALGAGGALGFLVPYGLAVATFAAGIVLLLSGATPPLHRRFTAIERLVALPVLEASHLMASVIGASLLLLARGLQRRVNGAFYLAIVLLASGSVLSLLKGFDYEEAAILTGVLILLVSSRRHFYRRTTLVDEPFTAGWITAIALVIVASVALGFFSFKNVEYSHDLWWEVSPHGNAPRFLRASVAAAALVFLFGILKLLRPPRVTIRLPSGDDLERASTVAHQSATSEAFLALTGDKRILFDDSGRAFLMYGVSGRSWVAMGDPAGDETRFGDLAWRFREDADRSEAWPVFYEISAPQLPLCVDLGLSVVKIGENARVPLEGFSLEGGSMKQFRRTVRQVEAEGIRFEVIPPHEFAQHEEELREVSDDWLAAKHTREKRFSLGSFDPRYLRRCPTAVARNDRIVAFANLWMPHRREELSLDLMRYRSDAPAGVMDYLFVQAMLLGRREGYRWFSLGMAPLAGVESRAQGPLWNRAAALAYQHGENFYNFQGLRQYKEKFHPQWEPRYLAVPRGLALPMILTNIATLIAGGVRGVVSK